VSLVSGTVLVTGATGGIGHAIARAFATRGARLILTGRRAEVLEPLAQEVGGRALVCDLSLRDHLDRLVAEVLAADVDVLVANAGLPATGLLADLAQDQIDRMLEVNLRAPIALARALTPAMVQRRRGHIVFMASLAGKAASVASSIYSATKFGLRGYALGIREDLRPHGVGVSLVTPGFIRDAGMFADARVELPWWVGTRSPEQVAEAVIRAIEGNLIEVEVAPLGLRLGAGFAGLAPGLASAVSRRLGGEKIAFDHVAGQINKR
jgi:short-subunit dehydrogenase